MQLIYSSLGELAHVYSFYSARTWALGILSDTLYGMTCKPVCSFLYYVYLLLCNLAKTSRMRSLESTEAMCAAI